MTLFLGLSAMMLQTQAAPVPADTRKGKDPNEVVCEKIEVLGTRLATKRVCMTRREWAEQRLIERQTVDKAQVQRGCGTSSPC